MCPGPVQVCHPRCPLSTPSVRPPRASRPLHTCRIRAHFVRTRVQVQPSPVGVHATVGEMGATGRGGTGTWVHATAGETGAMGRGETGATGRGGTGVWVHATAGETGATGRGGRGTWVHAMAGKTRAMGRGSTDGNSTFRMSSTLSQTKPSDPETSPTCT